MPKIPVYRFGLYTDGPMANRSLFAKFEVRSFLRSDVIVITTDGRTDRHRSNVLEFHADQMSPRNLGSQIHISETICIQPFRFGKPTNLKKVPRVFFLNPPHRGYISFVNTCGMHRNIDLRFYVPSIHLIRAKF